MKKIQIKEEKEKRESRNKLIIGLILVALMILSTAGYSFLSGEKSENAEKKVKYAGVEFIMGENGLWDFKVQDSQFSTQYNPEETEDIPAPVFLNINDYINKPLFFAGNDTTARQEIARNLQGSVLRMQEACISGYKEFSSCGEELPVKNCSQHNIIITLESDSIEIKQEENCVFIFAPYAEQTRAADSFIFKILNIGNF